MSSAAEMVYVELETPLVRGESTIAKLSLRRPFGGDFRDISMSRLTLMNYDEVRKLLPRIALEGLTEFEVDKIAAADLTEICNELSDFLFTKKRRTEFLNA